jgi:hypothetical protein
MIKKGLVKQMGIYNTYEENMDRLRKKITRIKNKCEKYGCKFLYNEIGEEFKEIEDKNGLKSIKKFITIEAEGVAIVNGWKFVGVIEHTDEGNIVRSINSIEIPKKYYNTNPICEHCKINRFRKDTYVVLNEESGEFKQVGKSCLKDFTGGMDSEVVASYISMFTELISGVYSDTGSGLIDYYETETMIRYGIETIKKWGYVRTNSDNTSTADMMLNCFYARENTKFLSLSVLEYFLDIINKTGFNPDSKDIGEETQKVLLWIEHKESDSNYINNLKTVCRLKYVSLRDLGILSSLYIAYCNDIEYIKQKEKREKERQESFDKEKDSKHIGRVGERITIEAKSITPITSWDTQWGTNVIYKILDTDNNVYIWKTSSYIQNKECIIIGTVKEHKEFKGIKQTEITRCKI